MFQFDYSTEYETDPLVADNTVVDFWLPLQTVVCYDSGHLWNKKNICF